jgi:hypothetical protein
MEGRPMAQDFAYPQDGVLRRYWKPGDFLDGQWVPLPQGLPDAADMTIATFFTMPRWAVALLGLRDGLVRPLGLRTGSKEDLRPPSRQEILDCTYPGIFAVHAASADEVVLGTDDRHLDFRVSVMRSLAEGRVAISTWVRPHNGLGRAYLAAVYPFHRLIVARCLAGAASWRRGPLDGTGNQPNSATVLKRP